MSWAQDSSWCIWDTTDCGRCLAQFTSVRLYIPWQLASIVNSLPMFQTKSKRVSIDQTLMPRNDTEESTSILHISHDIQKKFSQTHAPSLRCPILEQTDPYLFENMFRQFPSCPWIINLQPCPILATSHWIQGWRRFARSSWATRALRQRWVSGV